MIFDGGGTGGLGQAGMNGMDGIVGVNAEIVSLLAYSRPRRASYMSLETRIKRLGKWSCRVLVLPYCVEFTSPQ